MKKLIIALTLVGTMSLTGCTSEVGASTIDGYKIDEAKIASVFPSSAVLKDAGENMHVLLPCDVNESLQDAGATVESSQGLDIRDESEKETYYTVLVTKYSVTDAFPNMKQFFDTTLEECVYSNSNVIGNQTNFRNSTVQIGTRDLQKLGISGSNVIQFTNENSSLTTIQMKSGNIKMPFQDSTNSEVYVAKVGLNIFVLSISGRHFESNSSDFMYHEKVADAAFEGFSAK